jgi:hypothetical protein
VKRYKYLHKHKVLSIGHNKFEMLKSIYKSWFSDAHVSGFPSTKKFMKMKETLIDESEDVITSQLGSWSWMKATIGFK